MVSVLRRPVPALASFVDAVWYIDEPTLVGLERAIPTGTMQLVVNLRRDGLRWLDAEGFTEAHTVTGSGLCGSIARPIGIDAADQAWCVGASFRPGGAVPFFHPPADALCEPVIGLDSLWGRAGAVLRERLLEQPSPETTLRTLERALLERVIRADTRHALSSGRPDPMIEHATAALSSGAAVRHVADQAGLTPSTFNRRFRSVVGVNPKPFARVQRLQRLLRTIDGDRSDWAAAAADAGYFDQSHLINEFRALTGVTPARYRPRSPGEQNHIPIGG
ncbi:helix-turn-helix transcriptional regulator [Phytoactinopolyspora alkaliphila]|uniref:Helix-turn-helix transcriptional regulator n=1 Tax=Phytoactinopolyspora alkaliphila TaxID=1783498 RepID=A0A6N9YSK7_9ACTN|nr:AraC family transcriptional regulator [Phytoactinopolyspora alkaliphila]NED98026.1 helix-turn-helix transcriptional regulator [Phytoactinopolyspora alkaliphila]